MPLFSFLNRKPNEVKASKTQPLTTLQFTSRASWSNRDIKTLARNGFANNPICYRAIRMIAENAASLAFSCKTGNTELHDHPLLTLFKQPNPRQTSQTFMETLYGHLMLAGNAYVELVSLDNIPRELYCLRPDLMKLVPEKNGAISYEYSVNSQKITFSSKETLLHLTLPHPLDDFYGFAPLDAAARALDIHNAASSWSKALLDNAARPSGALIHSGEAGLTEQQFTRLKQELEENFVGSANAGRPMVLEGGLDWKPMSMSPKELDFLGAKHEAAREIALAFGVPPMLLGIPGDNAYANYAEANRAFYRLTILPLVSRTLAQLSAFLSAQYGETITLEPDLDAIEALGDERASLWKRVNDATFLSESEKRVAVGFGGE